MAITPSKQLADDPYAIDDSRVSPQTLTRLYRISKDRTYLRILPLRGRGTYVRFAYVHYGVGVDNRWCYCPRRTEELEGRLPQPCAVCDFLASGAATEMYASAPNELRAFKPQLRYLSAIVDLDEPENGVRVYLYGRMIFGQLETFRSNPSYSQLFHPQHGRNLTIYRRQKSSRFTDVEYNVLPDPQPSPIADPAWLDAALTAIDKAITYTPIEVVQGWLGASRATLPSPAPRAAVPPTGTTTPVAAADEFGDNLQLDQLMREAEAQKQQASTLSLQERIAQITRGGGFSL